MFDPQDSSAVSDGRKITAYEKIKQGIIDGRFDFGQPLVEAALAKWCGVSRTPVREALMRLEQDGLLARRDGGLVVRERSPEEILDIYDTRIALESTAARIAAARRTAVDLAILKKQLRVLLDSEPAPSGAIANKEFHRSIWIASHNESLIEALTRLDNHLARYPNTTLLKPGRWEEANREHVQMLKAIEDQRGDAACEIAAAHFTTARDLRLEMWAEDESGRGSSLTV